MRNVGLAFLTAILCSLFIIAACTTDSDDVVVEGDCIYYEGLLPVDSTAFRSLHHYWKGYKFQTTDSLALLSSVPIEQWAPDTFAIESRTRMVVADIVRVPTEQSDSIWLKLVTLADTLPQQGWVSECDLMAVSRPTHFLANLLSFLGPLADVPGGRYPDAWLVFYFSPTANPWVLPWPMAIVVVLLWALVIGLLAMIDKYLIERQRYRCGRCGGPLRHLGPCPHCGAVNGEPNPSLKGRGVNTSANEHKNE